MKVRRRTNWGGSLSRMFGWFNPAKWFAGFPGKSRVENMYRRGRIGGASRVDEDEATDSSGSAGPIGSPTGDKPRFTAPNPMRLKESKTLRISAIRDLDPRWLFGGTFVGSLLTGYLVAAIFFFPAPFFSAERPIPTVIALPYEEAVQTIENAGFEVGESQYENHPSYVRDQIVWQDPPEGVKVPPGTLIRLARSRGPQDIPVPDVSRYESNIASMLITRSGLSVQRIDSIQTALPSGVAVGTRPAAGATLSPGAGVTLIVSRGEPTLSVPDLAGLTLDEAREELQLLGLILGQSWQEFSNAQPEGFIFRQEPPAGTLIAPGTPINVVIARTP